MNPRTKKVLLVLGAMWGIPLVAMLAAGLWVKSLGMVSVHVADRRDGTNIDLQVPGVLASAGLMVLPDVVCAEMAEDVVGLDHGHPARTLSDGGVHLRADVGDFLARRGDQRLVEELLEEPVEPRLVGAGPVEMVEIVLLPRQPGHQAHHVIEEDAHPRVARLGIGRDPHDAVRIPRVG